VRRARELTCRELVELATEHLEGTLARERRALLDAHLAHCEGCVAYIDQMRVTVALLRGAGASAARTG
jgi:predicted anti-sigma-YlaC factor YlaD